MPLFLRTIHSVTHAEPGLLSRHTEATPHPVLPILPGQRGLGTLVNTTSTLDSQVSRYSQLTRNTFVR